MKIEKLSPVRCSICNGTEVFKKKVNNVNGLACEDCLKVVLSDGSIKHLNKEYSSGGVDPSFEMGDRIEGTVGVHEYNGNFCNRIK